MILFLADGFEETEAITLLDLMRRASYTVETVSITPDNMVNGGHGITIVADTTLDKVKYNDVDALILPGGVPGVPNLAASPDVLEAIQDFFRQDKYLIAICAAPFVLDKAGILEGKSITCYPGWGEKFSTASVSITEQNVTVDGKIITGQGVGSAIDLGLTVVEQISGHAAADTLKKQIVYRG